MTEKKPWYASRTILLGLAGVIAGVAGWGDLLNEQVIDAVLIIVGAGTAAFRRFAKAEIKPVVAVS